MRFSLRSSVVLLPLALLLGACEDPTWAGLEPQMATDTIQLAAPGVAGGLPTALDVTAQVGVIAGGRHPERVGDALQWDLTVRARDGQLVFLPAGAFAEFRPTRAAITRALEGQTFEGVVEAPRAENFLADSAVVIRTGQVYVARSREFPYGFGGRCVQYAKIEPLEVNPAAATVNLQIATNERCYDTRLVPNT